MTSITHLTTEASPRSVPGDALKAPRMFALVVVLELRKHLAETLQPLLREDVRRCVSLHNLFCALFYAIDIGCCTVAVLPICTTHVAEFGATETSNKWLVDGFGDSFLIRTSCGYNHFEAARVGCKPGRFATLNSAPAPVSHGWKGRLDSRSLHDIRWNKVSKSQSHMPNM
jgi:hypothetical protein